MTRQDVFRLSLQLARVDALKAALYMVPPRDKLASATIFSKLLSMFVKSRVTRFVQLHAMHATCVL